MGIIDRAVLALKDFVGDLARGQADVPLRLFPVYRDLAQLKGTPGVSERDLFFPDVTLKTPPHRRPKTIPADAVAPFVNKQRALFQKGLLAWLRNPPAGLDDMRRAVNQLHKIAAQLPEPRGVWWVAHGFLDAVETTSEAEWVTAAKALGNRIEKQMRGGSDTVTEALLRELLYAIGKAKPTTQRLKDIRQLYQIDNLFPRHDSGPGVHLEFDIERLEVALYDLHSRLDALKRSWVQYVAGEHKTAAPFRERVTAFKAKARDLGNQHLIKLLDAIALVAGKLPDPYPRQTQMLVIEMASAFLLVEHVLDNFTTPAPDLEQQIGIMGGWLLDAAMGKSTGEPPPGVRPAAPALAGRQGDSHQPAARRAGARRLRPRHRQAQHPDGIAALHASDARRPEGARPRPRRRGDDDLRAADPGLRRGRPQGPRRRHGLDRRRSLEPRLLPRALPPRPRARRGGDRPFLPPLREAQRAAAADGASGISISSFVTGASTSAAGATGDFMRIVVSSDGGALRFS
jgi:hypothetical protein